MEIIPDKYMGSGYLNGDGNGSGYGDGRGLTFGDGVTYVSKSNYSMCWNSATSIWIGDYKDISYISVLNKDSSLSNIGIEERIWEY